MPEVKWRKALYLPVSSHVFRALCLMHQGLRGDLPGAGQGPAPSLQSVGSGQSRPAELTLHCTHLLTGFIGSFQCLVCCCCCCFCFMTRIVSTRKWFSALPEGKWWFVGKPSSEKGFSCLWCLADMESQNYM